MQITEPVTMLTDYALAAACLYFALLLARNMGSRNRVSAWLWCAAFLASAVAALLGGIYHGLALHFDASTRESMWNLLIYAVGVSNGCMIGGIHAAYIQREDGTIKWIASGVLVTIVGAIIQQSGFRRHSDFNHNDIFHLIQIAAFYLLFKGACTLRDRQSALTR
jgi:hypothetical protein